MQENVKSFKLDTKIVTGEMIIYSQSSLNFEWKVSQQLRKTFKAPPETAIYTKRFVSFCY